MAHLMNENLFSPAGPLNHSRGQGDLGDPEKQQGVRGEGTHFGVTDLASDPTADAYQLSEQGQVAYPLWASVSSRVRQHPPAKSLEEVEVAHGSTSCSQLTHSPVVSISICGCHSFH